MYLIRYVFRRHGTPGKYEELERHRANFNSCLYLELLPGNKLHSEDTRVVQ